MIKKHNCSKILGYVDNYAWHVVLTRCERIIATDSREKRRLHAISPTPTGFKATGASLVNVWQQLHLHSHSPWLLLCLRVRLMCLMLSIKQAQLAFPTYKSAFVTDFAIRTSGAVTGAQSKRAYSRLQGNKRMQTNETYAEATDNSAEWDFMNGFGGYVSSITNAYSWMWKRAPGYFDIVNYTGTGANTTIGHNLGAVPTMMWIKCRDGAEQWCVYHSGVGATKFLTLNQNYGTQTSSQRWNNTTPTDTQFSLGSHRDVNRNGQKYIAYLFGEVSGISKMGAYTGTGNTLVINCGFTSGARFVLIKRTDSTSDWFVFDTARGITSGNVPRLMLNLNAAEVTNTNFVNPNNSGFELPGGGTEVNETPRTYVFYAIA